MKWWEELLIYQGLSALHTVIAQYGAKYYTSSELGQIQATADLLGTLGDRVAAGGPPKTS